MATKEVEFTKDLLAAVRAAHACDDGCELSREHGASDQHSEYLGSFMALDPCGRYHHVLSPNSVTSRCEQYWAMLEDAASAAGGWIGTGEGDPTDLFFMWA